MWSRIRKFFHRTDWIFVDFGTSQTTVLWPQGQIQEASLVGLDVHRRPVTFGNQVFERFQQGSSNLVPEYLLKESGIGQVDLIQSYTEYLQKKYNIPLAQHVFVSAPMDLTEVELRGLQYLFHSWGSSVHVIPQIWFEALAFGWNPFSPKGYLMVHLGAGYVEVAALSLFDTVGYSRRQPGFFEWVKAWLQYLKQHFDLTTDFITAEMWLRQNARLNQPTHSVPIRLAGYRLPRFVPHEIELEPYEIRTFLISLLESLIQKTQAIFEKLPPEIVSDILDSGAGVAGGAAQIPGMLEFLSSHLNIPFKTLEKPEQATILGWQVVMNHPELMENLKEKSYVQ